MNAICAHNKIIEHMVRDMCGDENLIQKLQGHQKFVYAGKLLFMNYLRFPDRKNGKKILKHLRALKEKEEEVISSVLDVLEILG